MPGPAQPPAISYLRDINRAVMTPSSLRGLLADQCPVGPTKKRGEIIGKLQKMEARAIEVDPRHGVAETDRRDFAEIRDWCRRHYLPVMQEQRARTGLAQWWGTLATIFIPPSKIRERRLPTDPLNMPFQDLLGLIEYCKQHRISDVPDVLSIFLLSRYHQEKEGSYGRNPFVRTELYRLATEDPLRLYSELGVLFYARRLEECKLAEASAQMVATVLEHGVRVGDKGGVSPDGRVIPLLRRLSDPDLNARFGEAHAPLFLRACDAFPYLLEEVLPNFASNPPYALTLLENCVNKSGIPIARPTVTEGVLQTLEACGNQVDNLMHWKPRKLVADRQEQNWQAYFAVRALRRQRSPSGSIPRSVLFDASTISGARSSYYNFDMPALIDLMLALETSPNEADKALAGKIREMVLNSRQRHLDLSMFIFSDPDMMRSVYLQTIKRALERDDEPDSGEIPYD